ncbi:recombinase family protein [Marinifilum sp. D737]|uniref:recombinase family protein n=1 Tax=Marinifilum sp. D737 TaxID=2969628 RepID=UPI002274A6B5|nr:recombinase family protein [Marinifilum sp. D737]MCY1635070.1 recombinase family protein [Marinifilum sp. D737]
MENAVIYTRVSTLEQDSAHQIVALKKYANYKGYRVLQEFEDKISGKVKGEDRAGFNEMTEFIGKNDIKHVLIWELSRLGRKMADVIKTVNQFAEKGINIYINKDDLNSLDENGDLKPVTMIILSVLSGFAQIERETIVERSKSGLDRHIREGGTKAKPPFGFKNVDKRLERNDQEGELVLKIFQLYLDTDMGVELIADVLNKLDPKKRIKNKWVGTSVLHILKNPIYYGERRYRHFVHLKDKDGKRIGIDKSIKGELLPLPSDCIPYISKERWERVQKKIIENTNRKDNSSKNVNILQGIVKCSKCGKALFLHRNPGRSNAYICLGRSKQKISSGKACETRNVDIDNLNSLMYHAMNEIGPVNMGEGFLKKLEIKFEKASLEFEKATDRIEELDEDLDRLEWLATKGKISVNNLDQFQRKLSNQMVAAVNKVDYWTNEKVSIETQIENIKNSYRFEKDEKGEEHVILTDGVEDYSSLNHYSSIASILKVQIKSAVNRVYIDNPNTDFSSLPAFEGKGYPTKVTIELINGKKYDYFISTWGGCKDYINPNFEEKELTQEIKIVKKEMQNIEKPNGKGAK